MSIREPELEIAARIGITPEAYQILRKLKVEKKQSMVKIVSDLILETSTNKKRSKHASQTDIL